MVISEDFMQLALRTLEDSAILKALQIVNHDEISMAIAARYGEGSEDACFSSRRKWGKKKTNKHKEFWRDTPWCASRLSRGHVPSVPWYVPSVPGPRCPWDVPSLSLGRLRGIPTVKFLYVIFLYRFFSLHRKGSHPHIFGLSKKIARFTKGRFRPY